MLKHLPLSWARVDISAPQLNMVKLPLSQQYWIPTAKIPLDWSFEKLYHEHLASLPGGLVLDSCSETLKQYLTQQGYQGVQIGLEGVLDLATDRIRKRSLRELARRGNRWGEVQEIPPTSKNQSRLDHFIQAAAHGQKVQLQHICRPQFDEAARGFAFVTPEQDWLGVMTLSRVEKTYFHTELLLRHHEAPVGVMEALILNIFTLLAEEGHDYWSLGGVPFVFSTQEQAEIPSPPLYNKQSFIGKIGRSLKSIYNFEGLFRFKDKFAPHWRPLYLCSKPHISWRLLLDLAIKTRYLHLVGGELWRSLTQLTTKSFAWASQT